MKPAKPLAIDLFCGLGGWTDGLLLEGWDVFGYDVEAHDYGTGGYPGRLVLQDVTMLHGSEFAEASLIVASPPCQAYSYRAMPWSRAKALPPPDNTLFETCFRLQREACEAAGWHIPMVVENVRGAQKWVGRAAWNYGSFYLWGDVPAIMPHTVKAQKFNPDGTAHPSGSWFKIADSKNRGAKNTGGSWFAISHNKDSGTSNNPVSVPAGKKTVAHANIRDGHSHTRHLTNQREHDHVKFAAATSEAWFDGKPKDKMLGEKGPAAYGSRTNARKAASALIAKIPLPLSRHIARVYRPTNKQVAA